MPKTDSQPAAVLVLHRSSALLVWRAALGAAPRLSGVTAMTKSFVLGIVLLSLSASVAFAQSSGPTPLPPAPAIPEPKDVPYPGGPITLSVDATDLAHHVFRAHETIPVAKSGAMTLLYPQWLPGHHSPDGPIAMLSGLVIHAGKQRIEWTRDPVEMFAFHIDVPEGAKTIEADFQFDSAVQTSEGRIMMTPAMLSLEWNTVALYPAGYFSRAIPFVPSVRLPHAWKFATALETASVSGDTTAFKPVPFNTLVDSPMVAGAYFERLDLDPNGVAPVGFDIVADKPSQILVTPEQLAAHRALIQQAYKLFGSHHYDHYDFLVSLSDKLGGIGLEHHQSSEDGTIPRYFLDWDTTTPARGVMSHELVHSWNGKFRRPADLWTPNFNVPMRDSLLWVYEGQTQYWGVVLAARSGLFSKQEALDQLAIIAATYDHYAGRAWKSLEDTTNDPIVAGRRPLPWRSWERSEDYYNEGLLTWLDADTLIREKSGGQHSLDDFARAFFGMNNGSYVTSTYNFDDVVTALNGVAPGDWAKFLHARLDDHAQGAPLDGFARGGYRLVYGDVENEFQKGNEKIRKLTDFSFSVGFIVDKDDTTTEVYWDSPAFKAGMTVGMKILAVNGDSYDTSALKDAIRWSQAKQVPIELLVEDNKQVRTLRIDYHAGLRFPHLEPIGTGPRSLDAILAAK
jgi:predicted metalloprotease with PDZ domain